ncbi:capsular biosynthesis protein, partial [Vibrio sp. D173a]|uniref:capsular biosynthesis protein n=1 Tax=Vibrio sp. D173a TaxID=2836349 RepID=UPI002555FE4A
FLFIVRDVYKTPEFVAEQASSMGIQKFHIVSLEKETRGQAETVTLGIEAWRKETNTCEDDTMTIFNIDTFRPGFTFPSLDELGDGYFEVFKGSGDNWSFAKPICTGSNLVGKTAEKKPISDLCCTGLYYFRSLNEYLIAYYAYLDKPETWEKGELYVAPLYNYLIANGLKVHYHLIPRKDVIFCGVPDEYRDFLRNK